MHTTVQFLKPSLLDEVVLLPFIARNDVWTAAYPKHGCISHDDTSDLLLRRSLLCY